MIPSSVVTKATIHITDEFRCYSGSRSWKTLFCRMNAAIKPWACERGSIWPPARPFPAQNFKDKHMSKTENKQNAYKNLLMESEWRKGKLKNYRRQSLVFKYKYPVDLPVCFVRGWKGFFSRDARLGVFNFGDRRKHKTKTSWTVKIFFFRGTKIIIFLIRFFVMRYIYFLMTAMACVVLCTRARNLALTAWKDATQSTQR